jgi:hypothetical protein
LTLGKLSFTLAAALFPKFQREGIGHTYSWFGVP